MVVLLRLRSEERGIALIVALGFLIVLTAVVASVTTFTRSDTRSTSASVGRLAANRYAESGLNNAYAILTRQVVSGGNPTAANMLGCAGATGPSDTNGPSNCSSPTPQVYCPVATCTPGSAGSVSLYGYFSGTNAQTFAGIAVPASTWLLVSTGYDTDPAAGGVTGHTMYAQVPTSGLSSGKVAAMWNHIFVTSPLVAGQCSLDFSGNNVAVNVPVYVIGNMCLGTTSVLESAQPIDLMVGGYLYLSGGGIGSAAAPITSGVVAGGCSSTITGAGATPCANGSWNYHVNATDTFIPQDAPEETLADIQKDYSTFDPGPAHACASGNNPYAPLASSVFDNNTTYNNSAGTFILTPFSSYTCNSQSGSTVGQLQWDNTNRKLTINGSIFIDGNLTINQSLTYTGTGVIEVSGTISISGNNLQVCAVANCTSTNWQGTSGNNQMLTLVSLASNTNGITFQNNAQYFQGSLWTQPSSTLTFVKNGDQVQGPMSIGKFDSTFNNANLLPLPVIKNMPVGAPIPPNTGVTLGRITYVG